MEVNEVFAGKLSLPKAIGISRKTADDVVDDIHDMLNESTDSEDFLNKIAKGLPDDPKIAFYAGTVFNKIYNDLEQLAIKEVGEEAFEEWNEEVMRNIEDDDL